MPVYPTPRAIARRNLRAIIGEVLLLLSPAYKLTAREKAAAKREAEIQAAMGRYFSSLSGVFGASFENDPPRDFDAVGVLERNADAKAARALLVDELERILAGGFAGGATATVAEIGLELATGFNPLAAEWAKNAAGTLISEIDDTTLRIVREAVEYFVTTPGSTLGDIISRLPFSEERARMIGITESTAAFAEGNQAAADALAKKYPDVSVVKTWLTNNDDRVCDICGPLDGVQVPHDSPFPGGIDNPPAHPNCRCSTSYRTNL